jgi:cation transport protein ChaC
MSETLLNEIFFDGIDPQWKRDPWIFAYGSLMWDPGFNVLQSKTYALSGWSRSFCVQSLKYRGTREYPGLVLGLDRGVECVGRLLQASDADAELVFKKLYAREMVNAVYRILYLDIPQGIRAITFVVDPKSPQYMPDISVREKTRMIAYSRGENGTTLDYLFNTMKILQHFNIDDPYLTDIADKLKLIKSV